MLSLPNLAIRLGLPKAIVFLLTSKRMLIGLRLILISHRLLCEDLSLAERLLIDQLIELEAEDVTGSPISNAVVALCEDMDSLSDEL